MHAHKFRDLIFLTSCTAVALIAQTQAIADTQGKTYNNVTQPTKVENQPASSSSTAIEEVLVTARRVEERQQDVPVAITVLSGEMLQEKAIVSLTDLNGKIPAMTVEKINSPLYTTIGIRAQRSTQIAPGQDPTVGYYFGEVGFSYPVGIAQQLFDIQSLEVDKGPQGTLFGRNTTGGAVVITPAKPTKEFGGSVTVGMTSFAHGTGYYTTGVLNIPVNDVLQLRAGVNMVNRDGYVKNLATPQQLANFQAISGDGLSNRNFNSEDSQSWRLSALLRPSTTLESYFLLHGSKYDDDGLAYVPIAVNPTGTANTLSGGRQLAYFLQRQNQDFWSIQNPRRAYNRSDNAGFSNTTTWEASDNLTIKNIIGHRTFRLDQGLSISAAPVQLLEPNFRDIGREFSEEFQLQGSNADKTINWIAGLYYFKQHIDQPAQNIQLPQVSPNIQVRRGASDNQSRAVFAQGTFKIPGVDGLSLTVGGRHTTDERKTEVGKWANLAQSVCQLTMPNNVTIRPISDCRYSGSLQDSENSFNLSLDYKLDTDTLVYLTRRKGYRAGGFNYNPGAFFTFGPFLPEFVYDWEGGLKKDWHLGEATLRTNLALYRQKYVNTQRFVSAVGNPGQQLVTNAASATINGGELEFTLIPSKGVELGGYVSYIDAKYNAFPTGLGNFTGNNFAVVPKTMYALRGKYELPLDQSIGVITLGAEYTHQSQTWYSDTNQRLVADGPVSSQSQPGYGILDLRIDWKSVMQSKYDLAFYVKNAQETKYYGKGVMVYGLGYNEAALGDPRVYGLEASFHF